MTSFTLFLTFVPLLAIILLAINFIFAPHKPYQEKDSTFECGFHSFLGQNRTQFSISFFIFALLFLLFDLEILLLYPYAVSAYDNSIYGLVIVVIFFLVLTLGFAFELGKNALKIDSKQLKQLISQIRLLEVAMSTRLTFWILCNVNKAALLAAAVAGVANFVATGDASGAESTAQAAEASSSAAEYAQWERDQLLRENPNGIVVTQTITEVVTQAIPGEAVTPTRETSVSSNGQQTTFTSTASGGVNTGNTVGSPAVPGEELGNETTTSGGDRNQQQ